MIDYDMARRIRVRGARLVTARERIEELEVENERLRAEIKELEELAFYDDQCIELTRLNSDKLHAENERQRQGIISLRTQYDELADKNERLRNNLRWVRDNTDSVSTRFYCRSVLMEDDDATFVRTKS